MQARLWQAHGLEVSQNLKTFISVKICSSGLLSVSSFNFPFTHVPWKMKLLISKCFRICSPKDNIEFTIVRENIQRKLEVCWFYFWLSYMPLQRKNSKPTPAKIANITYMPLKIHAHTSSSLFSVLHINLIILDPS